MSPSTNPTRPRRWRWAIALGIAACLLAACSDGGSDQVSSEGGSDQATTPTACGDETIDTAVAEPLPIPSFLGTLSAGDDLLDPSVRYRTDLLGTPLVFQLPAAWHLYMPQTGSFGLDTGAPDPAAEVWDYAFVTQPFQEFGVAASRLPTIGNTKQFDVTAAVKSDLQAGTLQGSELEGYTVDGHDVTIVDVTGGSTSATPQFPPVPTPQRIWVVDLCEVTPLVVYAAGTTDGWLDQVDQLVRSIDLGAPAPNPLSVTDEPWLYCGVGASEVEAGPLRIGVLDGLSLDLPANATISRGSPQTARLTFDGTISDATVRFHAPARSIGGEELTSIEQVIPLFSGAAEWTPLDDDVQVLGHPAQVFDVSTGGSELYLYETKQPPCGMNTVESLEGLTDARVWAVDTDRGPLVVIASTDADSPDDLATAIDLTEQTLPTLELVELDTRPQPR
jgi:hypothetical protein